MTDAVDLIELGAAEGDNEIVAEAEAMHEGAERGARGVRQGEGRDRRGGRMHPLDSMGGPH